MMEKYTWNDRKYKWLWKEPSYSFDYMQKIRLLHLHIPKTAGSSIREWFLYNCLHRKYIYVGHNLNDLYTRKHDKSFTVVRNTYDRIISVWEWALQTRRGDLETAKFLNKPEKIKLFNEQLRHIDKGTIDYLEFCIDENDPMVCNQIEWSKDIDYVLRLEELDNDFSFIAKVVKWEKPLNFREKEISYDKNKYLNNKDFINFVNKHWGDEIEHFKYRIEYD